MRELKTTTIQGITFLYPFPVVKENKYLIRCESVEKANELVESIANKSIVHPDRSSDDFKEVEMHSDQQTRILERT